MNRSDSRSLLRHARAMKGFARWGSRAVSVIAAIWLPACSLLLDADAKQCHTDLECASLGLTGSVCVENLCKKVASSSDSTRAVDMTTPTGVDRPGAVGMDAGGSVPAQAQPPSGGTGVDPTIPRAATGGTGAGGDAGSMPNSAIGSSSSSPPRSGAGGAGSAAIPAGTGGGGSAGTCAPGACPECKENRDCEQRGFFQGVCSAGVCYAPTSECSMDADCVSRGVEFVGGRCLSNQCLPNPQWRCEPLPPTVDGETRQIDVPVIDALSLRAISGMRIVACDKRDLNCERPANTALTGRNGHLIMTLPTNFAGYLQQTESPSYMPGMYFLPASIPDDGVLDGFPMLASGLVIESLAGSIGASVDAMRGHMMLIAEDCFRKPVGGVKFSSPRADASTLLYYIRDNLPSTEADATFDVGQGGFLNFPVGATTVALTKKDDGLVLNEISVLVRPGYISVAFIPPHAR